MPIASLRIFPSKPARLLLMKLWKAYESMMDQHTIICVKQKWRVFDVLAIVSHIPTLSQMSSLMIALCFVCLDWLMNCWPKDMLSDKCLTAIFINLRDVTDRIVDRQNSSKEQKKFKWTQICSIYLVVVNFCMEVLNNPSWIFLADHGLAHSAF